MDFDLAVIGGGAGGLVAAHQGVRQQARVALIQDGPLGGDCTWTGCVPSKTLLAAAAEGETFSAAMARVHRTIERIAAQEDEASLTREGITVISGRARLLAPGRLDVEGRSIRCRQLIVATGSRPAIPPIPGLSDVEFLTNETIFDLRHLPASMIVLGGGPIGCELAQAFAGLGTKITIVEALPRLLAREEPEASNIIAAALTAAGVDVRTAVTVTHVGRSGAALIITCADGTTVEAEALLVATGRTPSSRQFGLEELGVVLDECGNVVTDQHLATNVAGIWAVGDVTGKMAFTHAAARMGFVAADNALAKGPWVRRKRFDTRAIPWATFTTPEVGRVGLTEAEAASRGPATVAFLPLDLVDRAIITGATNGFVKIIAGARPVVRNLGGGQLLGATVVAPTGGELIHEAALAMHTKMFVGRLAQSAHAYPTWSVAIQQAALQFVLPTKELRARPAKRT